MLSLQLGLPLKYQKKNSTHCGPTAVLNALRVLGKKVTMRKVLAATDAAVLDGCGEYSLMQGLREFGYQGHEFQTNDRTLSKLYLDSGYPCLLCVTTDKPWDHWVCVLHLHVPALYIMWDSENSKKNRAENGCHVLRWQELSKLWRAPGKAQTDSTDYTYYGIEVRKVEK